MPSFFRLKAVLWRTFALSALLALVLLCSACSVTATTLHSPVWSDDGMEQAFVRNVVVRYPEGQTGESYQVHARVPGGGEPRPVGGSIRHAIFEDDDQLFYMREAGYIVATWHDDARPRHLAQVYYGILDIATDNHRVLHVTALKEPRADVIPSPDGGLIALITYTPRAGGGVNVTTRFIKGGFAAPEGDAAVLETYTFAAAERLLVRWMDTRRVEFWRPGYGVVEWEVGLEAPPSRPTERPIDRCGDAAAVTRSGPVNAAGVQIMLVEDAIVEGERAPGCGWSESK